MQQRLYFLPNNLRMSEQKHPKPGYCQNFSDKSREEKITNPTQTTKTSMNGKKKTILNGKRT